VYVKTVVANIVVVPDAEGSRKRGERKEQGNR
jgi:hypothetical protein